MAISFPTSLDTLTNPSSTDTLNSPSHSDQHINANDAIEALEAKVGADSSAVATSHDYKLSHLTTSDITDLTASASELNIMDGVTATYTELNQLDDVEVGGTATGDIVTIDDTQTLTNKTISSASNTLTGVATLTGTETLTNKTIDGDTNTLVDVASESLNCTVAFSAYKGAAQTINDTTFTKIVCDTEEFDTGADYDHATNYRFVAPVAGIYQFNGAIHLQGLADGDRYLATLYKNGSEFKRGADTRGGAANDGGAMVSALISLAATDYIELYVYYDGTSTKATLTAAQYNYFSGFLVGTT